MEQRYAGSVEEGVTPARDPLKGPPRDLDHFQAASARLPGIDPAFGNAVSEARGGSGATFPLREVELSGLVHRMRDRDHSRPPPSVSNGVPRIVFGLLAVIAVVGLLMVWNNHRGRSKWERSGVR